MIPYLRQWLKQNADEDCPFGGKSAYKNAIVLYNNNVVASTFRTFHSPLKTQYDYISAYLQSLRISKEIKDNYVKNLNITEESKVKVIGYSPFYIFFDQYSTITKTSFLLIFLNLAFIFAVYSFFLKTRISFILILIITMILVSTMGFSMVFIGLFKPNVVMLNGISLVNLLICISISVEFVTHFAKAYQNKMEMTPYYYSPVDLAKIATINTIPSVFSGIALTKFIGILVLTFSRSELFKLYFFLVYLSIIIFSSFFGLVFLPVFMASFGP